MERRSDEANHIKGRETTRQR